MGVVTNHRRTIPANTRQRQKLEDDFWQATDKHNEYLGALRVKLGRTAEFLSGPSRCTAAAVLTSDLVDSATFLSE